MNIKNQSGFSLIQVLLSLAILGIAVSGFMTLMANNYKHETNLNTLLEARELSGELVELSKSANCGIADLENPIPVTSDTWVNNKLITLNKGISGRFLELKNGDSYGRFKIESISIAPYYDRKNRSDKYVALEGANATDFANSRIIKGSLRLDATAQNTPKSPIRAAAFFYLDSSRNNIIGCTASLENTDLAAICSSFGGAWTESEAKCQLPCPPGLDEQNGLCVAKSVDADGEDVFCHVNEKCNVANKYILGI
nr:hypothetical protein BdHM001_22200 [Bdellovibrio sp. HM001]